MSRRNLTYARVDFYMSIYGNPEFLYYSFSNYIVKPRGQYLQMSNHPYKVNLWYCLWSIWAPNKLKNFVLFFSTFYFFFFKRCRFSMFFFTTRLLSSVVYTSSCKQYFYHNDEKGKIGKMGLNYCFATLGKRLKRCVYTSKKIRKRET